MGEPEIGTNRSRRVAGSPTAVRKNGFLSASFFAYLVFNFFVTGDSTMCRVMLVLSVVLVLFCGQIATTQASTVAYWGFNEKAPGSAANDGDSILDSSGNGHGAASLEPEPPPTPT